MPAHDKKPNLRTVRTKSLLVDSMLKLLQTREFRRLTVHDLCDAALISRPTFYSHFRDKYDLLEFWLACVSEQTRTIVKQGDSYSLIEQVVNQFVADHMNVISNLLKGLDEEVMALFTEFMISLLSLSASPGEGGTLSQRQIVFSHFCGGGMANLLLWQVKHKFPPELPAFSIYFYEILTCLLEWESRGEPPNPRGNADLSPNGLR